MNKKQIYSYRNNRFHTWKNQKIYAFHTDDELIEIAQDKYEQAIFNLQKLKGDIK